VGHYGSRGTTAAAMVHRVITIYEDVCCVLCVCCTEDYFCPRTVFLSGSKGLSTGIDS